MSVFPSLCPSGTIRLPLEGFSLYFVLEYFSKFCRESAGNVNFWQEIRGLYVRTNVHLYIAELLEREMFETKVLDKIKTSTLRSVSFFFFENRAVFWENVGGGIYCTAGQATDENIIRRMRVACRHTLRICNTYWFSTVTMFKQKHSSVTLHYIALSLCQSAETVCLCVR